MHVGDVVTAPDGRRSRILVRDAWNTEIIPELRRELPDIGYSRAFHRMAFSRDSVPKTMALFAEYPELDRLWTLFLEVTKDEARGSSPGSGAVAGKEKP